MQRIAITTLASVILLTSLSGCSLFKKKEPAAEMYDAGAGTGMTDTGAGGGAYPTYEDTTATTGGGRYHTVQKKETLYSISRQYYGDHTKWKEIYAANRSDISDPNRIRVGQRLVIP